jgi:hypothetical protein
VNWSASAIPRLFVCPTSSLLPQQDYRTKYADEGKDHHADLEAAIDVGDEDGIPPDIQALIRDGDETITEMAFAYDPATDTARELGRITREQYAALVRKGELPGKPDLIIRGNGRIVVVDHKSFEEVDDAERNTQAATYALMVARAWGYDECDVSISYRATWRRPSYATLNALDLAAHGDRLRQLQADIEKAREAPGLFLNDGRHCKYCNAFDACPRQKALARQVQSGELARQAETLIPLANDDEANEALDLLERVKMFQQRLTAAVYARAKERPIPRPSGKVFGPRETRGNRSIDGDAAYEAIREKYGQAVADKAVTREATQKGIEAALKQAGVRGATKAKDAVVLALEEAGKVTRKPKTVYEEHEPERPLLAAGEAPHLRASPRCTQGRGRWRIRMEQRRRGVSL